MNNDGGRIPIEIPRGTEEGGGCLECFMLQIDLDLNKEEKMSFKVGRLAGTVLVVSLLIQMQIAENGHAAFGAKIAFTCWGSDSREICVMDADGRNEERLTDDPEWNHQPSWSPDGDRIAFNRSYHITVMDSDGRNLIELTHGSEPAWSPDGTKIAFARYKALKKQVWVIDADGGNEVQLTNWGENYKPAWSPDGARIAFVSARRHGGPEIYAMDSDGNNQVRITHDLKHKDNPSWSPDGQWIAYDESIRVVVSQIYVVKTDGSGLTRKLTRRRPNKSTPAWSPDGDTIAYALWEPGIFTTINLMTPDGKHLEQLTEDDGTYRTDPDWFDPVGRSVSPAASYLTIWGEIKDPTSGL